MLRSTLVNCVFCFNVTATTEIYTYLHTLSLHDALPISLVLATHNPGKVREIQELLGPFGLDVVSAGALGLPEPEETGDSFEANAELKALAADRKSTRLNSSH